MGWSRKQLTSEEVEARLSRLPAHLAAVAEAVRAVAAKGAWLDEGGALLAGHQPERGLEAFEAVLHPGLPPKAIEAYQAARQIPLPPVLTDLLGHLNGAELFQLSLYGAPLSMIQDPPRLTRSGRAPLDLGSAAYWRNDYADADPQAVHFASRNVSYTGQVGYFLLPDGRVIGRGRGEAPVHSGPWPDLAAWLAAAMAEPAYDPPPLRIRRPLWARLRERFGRLARR